jgi:hypothetical protein
MPGFDAVAIVFWTFLKNQSLSIFKPGDEAREFPLHRARFNKIDCRGEAGIAEWARQPFRNGISALPQPQKSRLATSIRLPPDRNHFPKTGGNLSPFDCPFEREP